MAESFSRISRYYDERVERFGHGHEACDYGRAESQIIKYEILSTVMPMSGLSVLDVGCGFADYAGFLEKKHGHVRYSGVDLSPRMIEEAKRLRPDLDLRVANIFDAEFSESYDVVSANGIFYLMGEEAPSLMRKIIERMFALARRAVAVNSLSSWANDPIAGEFYADPAQVLEFARGLTPKVALRHDYHPRDFTVFLYKDSR